MARTLAGVLAGLMVLAAAGAASAGIPDPDLSTVVLTAGGLATCPAGDAATYQYITVTAKRSDATPIQGIPWSSFFFTVTGGDVTLTHVDTETDVNGQIRFTVQANAAIAYPGPVTVEVQIYTVVLNDSDNLPCNTYDLVLDGTVGLQDFVIFSQDYGLVRPRTDFNWSGGTTGLQDFVLFGQHYGHTN
jgi:hypothetical protein